MSASATLVVGQLGRLTLTTQPAQPGQTVALVLLHGLDGEGVGVDADGEAIAYPLTMEEGLAGVYSCQLQVDTTGPLWAQLTVAGRPQPAQIVRVISSASAKRADFEAGVSDLLAVTAPAGTTSLAITITDSEGVAAGLDDQGEAITWPQALTQVPGWSSAWYLSALQLTEGGTYQAALQDQSGRITTRSLVVYQAPQEAGDRASGWHPAETYSTSCWVGLRYLRRWTGFSTSQVSDQTMRELRATAIDFFIKQTNRWLPGWRGTWRGLKGQGSTLWLPVPLLLPEDGGEAPVVEVRATTFDRPVVETIDDGLLRWNCRGYHDNHPTLERLDGACWDETLEVDITGVWGSRRCGQLTIAEQQALVGMVRWLQLRYGVSGVEAVDVSRLGDIKSERTRDRQVDYFGKGGSSLLTGDRQTDETLARLTIQRGAWVHHA